MEDRVCHLRTVRMRAHAVSHSCAMRALTDARPYNSVGTVQPWACAAGRRRILRVVSRTPTCDMGRRAWAARGHAELVPHLQSWPDTILWIPYGELTLSLK